MKVVLSSQMQKCMALGINKPGQPDGAEASQVNISPSSRPDSPQTWLLACSTDSRLFTINPMRQPGVDDFPHLGRPRHNFIILLHVETETISVRSENLVRLADVEQLG